MLKYTIYYIQLHLYIWTSFTENVLYVQEPRNFGNPNIPVSHSVQYSHHMLKDQPLIPSTSFFPHVQLSTDSIDATSISETLPDIVDNVFLLYIFLKDSDESFILYIC